MVAVAAHNANVAPRMVRENHSWNGPAQNWYISDQM